MLFYSMFYFKTFETFILFNSNFLFIKEFCTTVLNINICILQLFMKNHMTPKTGVMADNDLLI